MTVLQEAVIVSAVRTAIGAYGGGLADVPAVKLGEICIREGMERASIGVEEVEEVIMGNVLQAGLGQNPALQAALNAGLRDSIPPMTIIKVLVTAFKASLLATH